MTPEQFMNHVREQAYGSNPIINPAIHQINTPNYNMYNPPPAGAVQNAYVGKTEPKPLSTETTLAYYTAVKTLDAKITGLKQEIEALIEAKEALTSALGSNEKKAGEEGYSENMYFGEEAVTEESSYNNGGPTFYQGFPPNLQQPGVPFQQFYKPTQNGGF